MLSSPLRSPLHTPFYRNDSENSSVEYDYDLIVIGGGSGGLACSKAAVEYGQKVCVLDYVKPSPQGSSWGLGGTCVNVGCIPKKHMHMAALLRETLEKDASNYGVFENGAKKTPLTAQFSWAQLMESIDETRHSTNFKYRVELRTKTIKYENYLGTFVDAHTVALTNEAQQKPPKRLTARRFVICVGGRPKPLECIGAQHAITSDDLFHLTKEPRKTLVIGGSYVALECAGFLRSLGYDVTCMVRTMFLRGFDQEMAGKIADYMEHETKVQMIHQCVPYRVEQLSNGQYKVQWCRSHGKQTTGKSMTEADVVGEEVYDTILNATGRYADVSLLGLEKVGVECHKTSGHIVAQNEQTNVPNIYALGDVLHDVPELTPTAILAGKLLAQRLYQNSQRKMDYTNVPTTIFTPLEYGCVGLSEENAYELYGKENVTVYHQFFTPLEWSLSLKREYAKKCYMKLICLKKENDKVSGFHYLGPNAGEITQGIAIAVKIGVTHQQLIESVGIHPTSAELMTMLSITKESGLDPSPKGCCG